MVQGRELWVVEHDEAKTLAQEIVQIIQDRNVNFAAGGPEASRLTAQARRKLGSLGTLLDKLSRMLDAPECESLSDAEKNRRRDLVYALKSRREQMQSSLKRSVPSEQDRDALLAGGRTQVGLPKETEATAGRETSQLLVLHDQIMREQDEALQDMEQAVQSTKHIALTIGEEVDLQTRLLDDLHEDVQVTQSKLKTINRRIKDVFRKSANWKGGLAIFLLIITLTFVVVLVFKLHK